MATEINIYKRMSNISNECGAVEKNGYNKFSNYKYVRAIDVFGAVQKMLIKHGVCLSVDEVELARERVESAKGGANFFARIKCCARFTNVDNPTEFIEVMYYSISSDTLDKDLFKAKTNGLKYLLSQQFLIVTDDFVDVEADDQSTAKASEAPRAFVSPDGQKLIDVKIGIIKTLLSDLTQGKPKEAKMQFLEGELNASWADIMKMNLSGLDRVERKLINMKIDLKKIKGAK